MKIVDMNWMQVEEYVRHDDRAVIPLGSTEQHAYLSLGTDAILSERVAVEAAEPLGVPVFPALAYGITPSFLDFPGSVSLQVATYMSVVRDILNSLTRQGFKRFVLVNGHGGNSPVSSLAAEWMATHHDTKVLVHNWWNAPETAKAAQSVDHIGSHGSWLENFPWNRVAPAPLETKTPVDVDLLRTLPPPQVRALVGDGNYGGAYEKPDAQMMVVWQAGVEETRRAIDGI
jgi:creatinine amidohydrolase